ncbi:MAG: RNA polymerase sigma factor [Phycisphaerae bacterium]
MPQRANQWQQWMRRHGRGMLLYARQFSLNAEDAEDAVHDGFVSFWEKFGQNGDPAILYACVRNRAMDIRRSECRRSRRDKESVLALAQSVPVFEANLETEEKAAEMTAVLELLDLSQREVLTLKIWAELTFEQIGHILNINANTAASRYRYALQHLRCKLRREVFYE